MPGTPQLPDGERRPRSISLGAQLMALSLAVALPLIGLVLWSGLRVIRLDRIRVENSSAQVVQVVAAHIERVLQSTRSVAERVARREGGKPGVPGCDPVLMQLPGVDDAVQNAATLDTLGRFTCSAIPLPPSVPPALLVRRSNPSSPKDSSSCTSDPGRRAISKPSPISTPLVACMLRSACANRPSSLRSQCT